MAEDVKQIEERKRREGLASLQKGEVADPISIAISIGISLAVSTATAALTRLLTPTPKARSGELGGQELRFQRAGLGHAITEIIGDNPATDTPPWAPSTAYSSTAKALPTEPNGFYYRVQTAGTSDTTEPTWPTVKGETVTDGTVTFYCAGRTGGGTKVAPIILWTYEDDRGFRLRRHEQTTRTGGGGKFGAPKTETTEVTFDTDIALLWGRGPLSYYKLIANTDAIYQAYTPETAFYQAEAAGNTKAGGAANVTDALASGGVAVTIPEDGSLQWNSVYGDGTAVRLDFYYKSSGPIDVEFTWVGGAGTTIFTDTLNSTGGVYALGYYSAPWILASGTVNTVKVKNLSASAIVFDRLGVNRSGGPTGVPSADIDPDDAYDQELPDSPNTPYQRPLERYSGELLEDVGNSLVGTSVQGNYAGLALYEGNDSQLPDAVIQAAVDAKYGVGSALAYLERGYSRHSNFFLTRWGGAVPNFNGIVGNKTLKTLTDIFGHWCDRTGVLEPTDYDFTGVAKLDVRGMPIGGTFEPAAVMEELARVFNVYFFEADKIYARVRDSQATVAALTSANLGWVDGEADEDESEELPGLQATRATETEIARRYEIVAADPDRDFEQNSQGTSRQITRSEKTERIELALTLYPEEMRETTQRELYEGDVEATSYSDALDWSYLWVNPGDTITVTEDDGFTHQIFLTGIRHNVGVMPFDGIAEEPAVYSQPVSTSGGGVFEIPPVPIPAMTIIAFYDGPPLRTEDEGKSGFYAWAVKRVGDGDWSGAALYKMVEGEAQRIAAFTTQATAGKAVTALGAWSDTETEDTTRTFTADAGTDVLTATAHELEDGETVMVSTTGTLPGGLSSTTLLYVRDRTANTLKLSLTAGGSAVDITSAGTGTHSVQRVIEVDLHDQTTVLESVTADQIENGANPCLFGDEVVQVRTWELVAGFDRRWRGKNFTRGRRGSEPFVGSHVAGERFVALDSAVVFVPQDTGELNIEREYKAVTSGQSLDDAATVLFVWSGGTLKYPPPGIQASLDSTTGDWRLRVYGMETRDPEGERYGVQVVGGRSFTLRGAASRPVSLSTTTVISDSPPPPGKGSYRTADAAGNSVTGPALRFVMQLLQGERTALSATYRTTLDATDSPANNASRLHFTSGALWGLTMWVEAETSTESATLFIEDNISGTVFTDASGEATDTRYTAEFRDSKVYFYRNRNAQSNPFYVYPLPVTAFGGAIEFFPCEVAVAAGNECFWDEVEIDDEGAAVLYTADEQVEDFGSAQASITVRASQQRVVEGVVVDGQITEVVFP